MDRVSVGPLQIQRPQHTQLNHAATATTSAPTGRQPSHAPITAESLADASLANVRLVVIAARAFSAFDQAGAPADPLTAVPNGGSRGKGPHGYDSDCSRSARMH